MVPRVPIRKPLPESRAGAVSVQAFHRSLCGATCRGWGGKPFGVTITWSIIFIVFCAKIRRAKFISESVLSLNYLSLSFVCFLSPDDRFVPLCTTLHPRSPRGTHLSNTQEPKTPWLASHTTQHKYTSEHRLTRCRESSFQGFELCRLQEDTAVMGCTEYRL